jgi:hypothetical protein
LGTRAAHAQAGAAAAEQLFRDASTLLARGETHEACTKFGESQKLDPQLGTLLNLATCHEKEGKVATAWTEFSELVDQAGKAKDQKRLAYAKKRATKLEAQLPRLQLQVPAGTAELRLDGIVLGEGVWTSLLPVDPGDHWLAYSGPGKKPAMFHVAATLGATATVALPALADAEVAPAVAVMPPPVVAPSEPPPEPAPTNAGGPLRTAGFVTGGVGVVGLGLGATFGGLALSSKSTVSHDCNGSQCSSTGLSAVSSARSQATASTVGFVAGGVCVAAGLAMVLVAGRHKERLSLAPTTVEHGGGLATFGEF